MPDSSIGPDTSIILDREPVGTRVRTRRRLRSVAFWLLLALAAAAIGWWLFIKPHAPPQPAGGGRGAGGPVPVVTASAEQRDVPIYLDALGTVQASATVTVKAMVDGPLLSMNFKEGQDVKAGDVLAKIDPRTYQATLDQAVAKKAQDEATLANARLDLDRYQKLAKTAYTSAQTADTQKAVVAQDEAQVAQDQAQIDSAKAELSYTTITSPIDGRTGMRQVDAGNIVHAADTTGMVVLTTLKPISVIFSLPQQDLQAVKAADARGEAAVLAQTADGKVLDRGTLAVLDNQVDATTGTIKLKASFPNEALKLWPGGFVNIRLLVDTRHGAITVPPAAVQRGPRGAYVYVVNADNTASRKLVSVGHEDEAASIIKDGVAAGDQVIVDGASRVNDGAKVAPTSPENAPAAPGDAASPAAHQHKKPAGGGASAGAGASG